MRRRFMGMCVGKGYNKAAAAVALHFVTSTKKALRLWPTSSRAVIMLLVSNAAIIVVVIILVDFILTVMREILPQDYEATISIMTVYAYCWFPCHAVSCCLILLWLGEGCVKEEGSYSKRISRCLPLPLPISPSRFLSLASDVRPIELGAQPLAVRSQLMESTWLTDKPTENKLSESCRPFINLAAVCGTALTPPNAISGGCFIFSMLKLHFKFLFINVYFLFLWHKESNCGCSRGQKDALRDGCTL